MTELKTPTPADVRRFVGLQLVVTLLVVILVFVALGGAPADDLPPLWQWIVLLALVFGASALVSRWWTRPAPLPAGTANPSGEALRRLTAHLARSFLVLELPLVVAALLSLAGPHQAWAVLITAVPGLAALVFGTWPTRRNVDRFATALEADGVTSGLREAFAR